MTVVPTPTSLSIFIEPPVISVFCFSNGSPSPTLRVVRVVKNGLVTFSTVSALMPQPSSLKTSVSVSAS